jgi:hypothetical protein
LRDGLTRRLQVRIQAREARYDLDLRNTEYFVSHLLPCTSHPLDDLFVLPRSLIKFFHGPVAARRPQNVLERRKPLDTQQHRDVPRKRHRSPRIGFALPGAGPSVERDLAGSEVPKRLDRNADFQSVGEYSVPSVVRLSVYPFTLRRLRAAAL